MVLKLLGEKKRQQRDQILKPVIEYLSQSARRDLTDKEIMALQMHYEEKPFLEALTTLFKDKVG
jgi:hypothetical protein